MNRDLQDVKNDLKDIYLGRTQKKDIVEFAFAELVKKVEALSSRIATLEERLLGKHDKQPFIEGQPIKSYKDIESLKREGKSSNFLKEV